MPVERRAYMRTIKRSFIGITVLFFIILAIFGWVIGNVDDNTDRLDALVAENQQLILENQNRVAEIQASRISSCKTTYEGIRGVVKTFFTPPPSERSEEVRLRIIAFDKLIDNYVLGCEKQTKPGD